MAQSANNANSLGSYHRAQVPDELQVSKKSKWKDPVWYLDYDNPAVNGGRLTVRWDYELPDGSKFTDPQWAPLLDSLKRFTWSLLTERLEGPRLKVTTLHRHDYFCRQIVGLMVVNHVDCLNDITNEVSWDLLTDYMLQSVSVGDDIHESSIRTFVSIFKLLREQGPLLERVGAQYLPEAPFDGLSGSAVARKVEARVSARIPPLPDEVALPIMAAAYRLIWKPAEEVIDLYRQYREARYSDKAVSLGVRNKRARDIVTNYNFSTLAGEDEPWHDNIQKCVGWAFTPNKGATRVMRYAMREFHQLIRDIRNACVVVLQSQTGMRIGEIASLLSGWDIVSGFPACISIRRSRTGLNELFFVKGMLYKLRDTPEEAEWLIGMRPVGSKDVPAPVHAIHVLQRLHDQLRPPASRIANNGEPLLLNTSRMGSRPLGEPGVVFSAVYTDQLWIGQKDFVLRYVDLSHLPDMNARGEDLKIYRDSLGTSIRSHQWRKNFAQYIWRIDRRMLAAIAQQFKHLSLAMTEEAYIGNDPTLLSDLNSYGTRRTVDLFRAWAKGEQPAIGHLAKHLRNHRDELTDLIKDKTDIDADDLLERYVIDNDLRIWFSEDGKCMIGMRPLDARCHALAGTSSWQNKKPNYQTRQPSVCAGCLCYYIDHEHEEFWIERYTINQKMWMRAKAEGKTNEYRICRLRRDQAAAVLKAINSPIPVIA